MKCMLIFAAVLVAVSAQEYYANYEQYEPLAFDENNEERHWGVETEDHERLRRDVTGSYPVGQNGKVIGTLGNTANGGLFGEGGYQHTLINDDRGTLTGQAYGTRVLGPTRDSTHYGGKLNWNNNNSMASLDASKRLVGRARGQGGYEHNIINDDRGRLSAQGYGTRVLGPRRDSTHYGGKLSWQDQNARASVDASKRMGGRARVDVDAGGRWEPFKNSELTAGGFYSHREGRPSSYGGRANFNYRF